MLFHPYSVGTRAGGCLGSWIRDRHSGSVSHLSSLYRPAKLLFTCRVPTTIYLASVYFWVVLTGLFFEVDKLYLLILIVVLMMLLYGWIVFPL